MADACTANKTSACNVAPYCGWMNVNTTGLPFSTLKTKWTTSSSTVPNAIQILDSVANYTQNVEMSVSGHCGSGYFTNALSYPGLVGVLGSQVLCPSPSSTASPSGTATGTASSSVTGTSSSSATGTPSSSHTGTTSRSQTGTPSSSRTGTPSSSHTGTPTASHTGTPSSSRTGTPSSSVTGTAAASHTGTPSSSHTGTPSVSVTVSKSLSSTPLPVASGPTFKCYGDAHSSADVAADDDVCGALPLSLTHDDSHHSRRGECGACWACDRIAVDDFELDFTLDLSSEKRCRGPRVGLKLHSDVDCATRNSAAVTALMTAPGVGAPGDSHELSCAEDRAKEHGADAWALYVSTVGAGGCDEDDEIVVELSREGHRDHAAAPPAPPAGVLCAGKPIARSWDFTVSYKQVQGRMLVTWKRSSPAPAGATHSQWIHTDLAEALHCSRRHEHCGVTGCVVNWGFVGSADESCSAEQGVSAVAYTNRGAVTAELSAPKGATGGSKATGGTGVVA